MSSSLDSDAVIERLTPLFRDIFQDDSIVVTPDLTAEQVDRWDSLSHVDLMLLVEEAFSIRIPTREVNRMKNVGDLVRVVLSVSR